MAGIGFTLQKMLNDTSSFSTMRAYIYAAAISSGPWLFTTLTIGILNIFAHMYLEKAQNALFKGIIIYAYAFSLITTGLIQMVCTRFVSDKLFNNRNDAVLPTYITALVITSCIQMITATIYYAIIGMERKTALMGTLLYVVVSDIWIAMIFLTAMQNYRKILLSFVVGGLGSLAGSVALGKYYAVIGFCTGFTIGQGILLIFLTHAIVSEFEFGYLLTKEFSGYFKRFPQLIIIGFSYNCALWVDKFLFWFTDAGEQIYRLFYYCPVYDSAIYIAYVFTVPSLALFIIRLETDFFIRYKNFYSAINNKFPLWVIQEKKQLMVQSLYRSIAHVIKVQGVITLVVILFAGAIITLLKMEYKQIALLRICALGTFLHVLILFLSIIILYFDFRNLCMGMVILFLITNTVFTYISLVLGFAFYGYGYMFSCLVTLITGFLCFARKIDNLEYITFMNQPVISSSDSE